MKTILTLISCCLLATSCVHVNTSNPYTYLEEREGDYIPLEFNDEDIMPFKHHLIMESKKWSNSFDLDFRQEGEKTYYIIRGKGMEYATSNGGAINTPSGLIAFIYKYQLGSNELQLYPYYNYTSGQGKKMHKNYLNAQ